MAFTEDQLKENWERVLYILDAFLEICAVHNIQYQMVYGSALGAVRHGGFIPWDKNLDASMPLPDYLRFIELCQNGVLPEDLALKGRGFYESDARQIPRLVLKDNLIKCAYLDPNLDLSVYCAAPNDPGKQEKLITKARLNNKMYRLRNVDKKRSFPYNVLKGMLNLVPNTVFEKSFDKMVGNVSDLDNANYVVSLEAVYGNEVFPKSWIYENIQFPFEGRMVNITANYDEYLTLVYGADWKTPTKFKKDL